MSKNNKVAIIGVRGLRVVYSGFETFINRLIKSTPKGKLHYHVFVRKGLQKGKLHGKNYSLLPISTPDDKYLGTFVYGFLSTIRSLLIKLDSVLYLGVANTPFIFLQKLRKRKVMVNVDGIDWKRKRWPALGKMYLRFCEKLSVVFADILIADAKSVYHYYKKGYKIEDERLTFIPYGAEVNKRKPGKTLSEFGLEANKYLLFVGRLVPENCPEDIILAMKDIKTDFKCAIVGGSYHEDKYYKYLTGLGKKDERVVFTGVLKGKRFEEVFSNPYAYIETKTAGGTHPSLLEAMAYKNTIIAKDVEELKEVLGKCAFYYSRKRPVESLKEKIKYALKNPKELEPLANCAQRRVRKNYNWDSVITKYHKLMLQARNNN